jgi:hypothetical protein
MRRSCGRVRGRTIPPPPPAAERGAQSSAARRGRRPLQSSTSSTSTCWPAGLVSWGIWIMEYVSRPAAQGSDHTRTTRVLELKNPNGDGAHVQYVLPSMQ